MRMGLRGFPMVGDAEGEEDADDPRGGAIAGSMRRSSFELDALESGKGGRKRREEKRSIRTYSRYEEDPKQREKETGEVVQKLRSSGWPVQQAENTGQRQFSENILLGFPKLKFIGILFFLFSSAAAAAAAAAAARLL